MKRHKFLLGNPCGPCEWHIEPDVRIFAWFDFIYQSVFVIPVILQFKIYKSYAEEASKSQNTTEAAAPDRNATTTTQVTEIVECDDEKIHLAFLYSALDIVNLSSGMLSDIILYIGGKQHNTTFAIVSTLIFIFITIIREVLHGVGIYLHVLRCSPETYPYEFVVRLLCQYMMYGLWISVEYLGWLIKGRLFVPKRGQMEPPDTELEEKSTVLTILTSTSDLTANPSSMIQVSSNSGHELPPEGEYKAGNVEPMKRKKSRKSKLKAKDNPDGDQGANQEAKK